MRIIHLGLVAGLMLGAAPVVAQDAAPTAPAAAPAADPERLALAKRYIEAADMDALVLGSMEPMLDAMATQQDGMTAEQQALVRGVVLDAMKATMPAYLDQIAALYAVEMTTEELTALADFYETEMGRSITAKTVSLTARSAQMFESYSPILNAEIMKRMEAVMATQE